MHRVLERQLRKLCLEGDAVPTAKQWARFLERVDLAYTEADQDRYTSERALDLSSAEMRKRFTELRAAQGQLVLASRKAGMADVATSVLHNVGNVLNSVNVSATVISDALRSSPRSGLTKSVALLESQPAPGRFIDEDPRGKKLLPYLHAVDKALEDERETMLREAEALSKHIEHIKSVISHQLAFARGESKGGSVVERISLDALLDDATSVAQATFGPNQNIRFERQGPSLTISTDRHKVTQILLNLLTNARDAIGSRPGAGLVVLRTSRVDDKRIALEVQDDGIGVSPENLSKMFGHGFTTKPDGHGFGLHSCACAALELGGTLTASSEGEGRGATFRLVLATEMSRS